MHIHTHTHRPTRLQPTTMNRTDVPLRLQPTDDWQQIKINKTIQSKRKQSFEYLLTFENYFVLFPHLELVFFTRNVGLRPNSRTKVPPNNITYKHKMVDFVRVTTPPTANRIDFVHLSSIPIPSFLGLFLFVLFWFGLSRRQSSDGTSKNVLVLSNVWTQRNVIGQIDGI